MLPRLRSFLPFLSSTASFTTAAGMTKAAKTPLEPTVPTSIAAKEARLQLTEGGPLQQFYGANGCECRPSHPPAMWTQE
jgi:hypothetical protein